VTARGRRSRRPALPRAGGRPRGGPPGLVRSFDHTPGRLSWEGARLVAGSQEAVPPEAQNGARMESASAVRKVAMGLGGVATFRQGSEAEPRAWGTSQKFDLDADARTGHPHHRSPARGTRHATRWSSSVVPGCKPATDPPRETGGPASAPDAVDPRATRSAPGIPGPAGDCAFRDAGRTCGSTRCRVELGRCPGPVRTSSARGTGCRCPGRAGRVRGAGSGRQIFTFCPSRHLRRAVVRDEGISTRGRPTASGAHDGTLAAWSWTPTSPRA
jgi:hypothetical protein